MGRGTAWKAHDVDMVRGWMAAGKTTTAMATLRPDWSRSSIKKLVARLKARAAAGDAPGPVFTRKRSFTAFSSAQLDELKAELPTLPRVSVNVVAKKLGTSRSTAWRVLHDRLEKKPYKPIRAQRITSATILRRLAFCRLIRLRLGARVRLCKGPSLPTLNLQRVFFSDEKVYKCEYLQHPQNFRHWVDRTRKRMDCAALLRTDRSQFNPGIMVAMIVGWNGVAGVHFVEPGVKVNSAYYCEHMLQQCYWPGILANLATNEQYHFYADNAPSHVSASTREFIRLNKPHNEELLAVPASSPDLNVCDYYLWKAIQDRLQPRYGTRVELRADILRQTLSLPLEEIRRAICSWPHRLLQCHKAGGGHFEG